MLEAAASRSLATVNGVTQSPYEGTSHAVQLFNDAKAAERHETQYFEMFCNRGIYHKGWSAVTKHRTPWMMGGEKMPAFDDDVWELYDGSKDWTQANDLSKQMPEKLHELQRLWLIEAVKYNVLPLDDRQIERLNPDLAGRPGRRAIRRSCSAVWAANSRNSMSTNKSFFGANVRSTRGGGDQIRAGRPLRWLEPVCQGRQSEVRLQRARNQVGTAWRPAHLFAKARRRCAWSSPTMAAAWARAAT